MEQELPKTNVLSVEDDPKIQRLMASVLRAEGYNVITAADGGQALERVRDSGPSVILVDLLMPGVDGWEFVRRLRAMGDNTPVVVISAVRDLPREARGMGADYLEKPFGVEQLVRKVETAASR
jgi:DNA-binding response OmpR family regulator